MRARRLVVTAVVLAVVAGCSSGPDEGALELDGTDASAAPPGSEPEPVNEPSDEPSSPSSATEDDEPLYPPLPELEPDPNSDIPIEDQELFLAVYREAYEAIETSLATNSVDEEELGRVLVPSEVGAVVATVDERLAAGTELRSPDAEVRWVEVTDAEGGEAVVQDCRIAGPRTGSYDSASGEQVGEEVGRRARVVEFLIAPIDVDGDVSYRVAGIRSGEDRERCDV